MCGVGTDVKQRTGTGSFESQRAAPFRRDAITMAGVLGQHDADAVLALLETAPITAAGEAQRSGLTAEVQLIAGDVS